MTKSELAKIMDELQNQEGFENALKNCCSNEEFVEVFEKYGYRFTVEQFVQEILPLVQEEKEEAGELDEADLENVSGGGFIPRLFWGICRGLFKLAGHDIGEYPG